MATIVWQEKLDEISPRLLLLLGVGAVGGVTGNELAGSLSSLLPAVVAALAIGVITVLFGRAVYLSWRQGQEKAQTGYETVKGRPRRLSRQPGFRENA